MATFGQLQTARSVQKYFISYDDMQHNRKAKTLRAITLILQSKKNISDDSTAPRSTRVNIRACSRTHVAPLRMATYHHTLGSSFPLQGRGFRHSSVPGALR